jgi:cytochrome c biogenesis protein CcmG/thiol:disulfide interchange protein DsbE
MLRKTLWTIIIILMFFAVMYVFSLGLKRDPQQMPSALLNKPLPDFNLTDLFDENKTYNKDALIGELFFINVFASWCPPCAKEHDVIVELAALGFPFVGLNYQDNRGEAQIWLAERGNPYQKVLFDEQGSVGMDWGVIGVPETFLIDAQGIVRYRHIGILTLDIWHDRFMPVINEFKQTSAISPYPFNNQKDEQRFIDISAKLRCLVCQNQTVLDSDATLAKDLRQQVYDQILAGHSDEEIIEYLTTRYGDFILYQPPVNKSTGFLWFGPMILLLIAGVVVGFIIRRAHMQHKGVNK